jgi:putative ABC transport system substrate-binding protein
MKRREFIAGLGSAAAWPVVARAQQPNRIRRIGALIALANDDPRSSLAIAAFSLGLQEFGWTVGRNVRIDWRWGGADRERIRTYAAELVALAPDILLTAGAGVRPLQQATRTIPIVFAGLNDPVGGGFVRSLARPGGNITGFGFTEYGFSAKWLELLKQIAPRVTRVAVIRDPFGTGGPGFTGALQGVSPSFKVDLYPIDASEPSQIESGIAAFAGGANGGMIVPPSGVAAFHRELILSLAAKYRLPAVYGGRIFVDNGGLISYGSAQIDLYRLAAGYVDRILKGDKPADLPVQQVTKLELVINLKTAKALGLTIPETLFATADEVIQ